MEGSGSSGFDMSKMSTAEKLLAGASILLLIVSFFPWQQLCPDNPLFDCSAGMWSGSLGWAGVLAGLLAIALVVVGVLSMTGSMANMNMGTMSADKLVGFLGLGVAAFGLIRFLGALAGFGNPAWGAFVGLVLLVAIGWGAWQKVQSSGGFQMGGTGGGTMGGGTTPPPTTPPPSTPPPSTPPTEPPPSGGMPPSGSSDM